MTITELTEILGWASLINIGYLLLATIVVTLFKKTITAIHKKIFSLNEDQLSSQYFVFLSNYKIVTLVFFVAPYLALKIMGV